MTSNYSRLRTAVYKKIYPDGVPLEFGCEVFIPGENNFSNRGKRGRGIITQSYVGRSRSWSGYDPKNDAISVYMLDSDVYRPVIGIEKNKIEIIGKPLSIADVLRALQKKEAGMKRPNDNWFTLSIDGDLLGKYDIKVCCFDLSKPLSDPANDAACGAVLALIENHD